MAAPERRRLRGRWWRQVPAGQDPLGRSPQPADGRWQRGDVVEGLYLAEEAETAWAEWYRLLAELALPPHRSLPRDLWAVRLSVTVADLSTPERLEALGLGVPRPGRAGWPAYQAAGEALAADGWAGLMAPSAARPTGLVVCLFRGTAAIAGVRPVPPPEHTELAPPPPRGLTT